MNFLAHLFLSFDNDKLTVGNFMADFIRNKEVELLPTRIKNGVFLHRAIDQYTDTHKMVKQGTKRLHASQGKYAPVVIDIFYDFLLASNWEKYSDLSYTSFSERKYKILEEHLELMPPKLQKILPKMIADEWLRHYQSLEGLEKTFNRVGKRTKFTSGFDTAVVQLMNDYESLNEEFNYFFPNIIKMSEDFIADLSD